MDKLTTDYARSIGVDPDKDRSTARGCYLTTADIKHIRHVLQFALDAAPAPRSQALSMDARQWTREILDYTKRS